MNSLSRQIEDLRRELYQALDDADGDHLDPTVQRLAAAFDELLVEDLNRHKADTPSESPDRQGVDAVALRRG